MKKIKKQQFTTKFQKLKRKNRRKFKKKMVAKILKSKMVLEKFKKSYVELKKNASNL